MPSFSFHESQKRKEGEKKKTSPTLVTQIICKVIYASPKSKVRSYPETFYYSVDGFQDPCARWVLSLVNCVTLILDMNRLCSMPFRIYQQKFN